MGVNEAIQGWINGLAGYSGLLDGLMKAAANDLVYLVVPLLVLLWFWPSAQRAANQRVAVAVIIAVALGEAGQHLVGELRYTDRPYVVDSGTRLLISHAPNNSFPSGHTSFAFAVAGTLLWWRTGAGLVAISAACLVGVARVFVGVHWPVDIVVGAALGLAVGTAAAKAAPALIPLQRWASRRLPPLLLAPP